MPEQNNPQQAQDTPQLPPMSDHDHAAALGFITTLSQNMFHQDPMAGQDQAAPQQPSDAGTESPMPLEKETPDIKSMETSIMDELANLKDAIETKMRPTDTQKEIEAIRKELTGLLESNDETGTQES